MFSVVVHEVSHGSMAYALGDNTAKEAGRLTLNPIPHIDPVGSILLPAVIGFGWAKPVPYNPYNLKSQKWGPLLVGVAGPASNIIIAIVFGFLLRFSDALTFLPSSFFNMALLIATLNLGLALFNLIPIPPLDGSKVLFAFLPRSAYPAAAFLESYGFIILLFLLFFTPFLSWIVYPLASLIFTLITGFAF